MTQLSKPMAILWEQLISSNPSKKELQRVVQEVPVYKNEAAIMLLSRQDLDLDDLMWSFEHIEDQGILLLVVARLEEYNLSNDQRITAFVHLKDTGVRLRLAKEILAEGEVYPGHLRIIANSIEDDETRLETARQLAVRGSSNHLDWLVQEFLHSNNLDILHEVIRNKETNPESLWVIAGDTSDEGLRKAAVAAFFRDDKRFSPWSGRLQRMLGLTKDRQVLASAAKRAIAHYDKADYLETVANRVRTCFEGFDRDKFWASIMRASNLSLEHLRVIFGEVTSDVYVLLAAKKIVLHENSSDEDFAVIDEALGENKEDFWRPLIQGNAKLPSFLIRNGNRELAKLAGEFRLGSEDLNSWDLLEIHENIPPLRKRIRPRVLKMIAQMKSYELESFLGGPFHGPAWEALRGQQVGSYALRGIVIKHPEVRDKAWEMLKASPGADRDDFQKVAEEIPELAEEAGQLAQVADNSEIVDAMIALAKH